MSNGICIEKIVDADMSEIFTKQVTCGASLASSKQPQDRLIQKAKLAAGISNRKGWASGIAARKVQQNAPKGCSDKTFFYNKNRNSH